MNRPPFLWLQLVRKPCHSLTVYICKHVCQPRNDNNSELCSFNCSSRLCKASFASKHNFWFARPLTWTGFICVFTNYIKASQVYKVYLKLQCGCLIMSNRGNKWRICSLSPPPQLNVHTSLELVLCLHRRDHRARVTPLTCPQLWQGACTFLLPIWGVRGGGLKLT